MRYLVCKHVLKGDNAEWVDDFKSNDFEEIKKYVKDQPHMIVWDWVKNRYLEAFNFKA